MKCKRCDGMAFLDRTFSDNTSYEVSCIICGGREFIKKNSKTGVWITMMETLRNND